MTSKERRENCINQLLLSQWKGEAIKQKVQSSGFNLEQLMQYMDQVDGRVTSKIDTIEGGI